MKKFFAAAAVALGMATMMSHPALADRTLRLSSQMPTNHPVNANIRFFKDQVEKLSNGDLTIEIYDSAQLYKGSEIPQAVGAGAIDMGVAFIDEYAGTLPAAGLFSVAFLFPNDDVLARAAGPDSPVRQKIDQLIGATGTHVLWWQDYGPVQLLSKDAPIRTPADMKDKKVRVIGKPSGNFVTAVGGVPVKIGGSEQFMAYQRGTVDIGMSGATATQDRKLYEVMDQMTVTNQAQTEFLIVINDGVWKDLSDQERAWMGEAAKAAETKMRQETHEENMAAQKYLADKTPMTVTQLSPEELAAWQKAAAPAVDAFIKGAGPVGAELVKEVKAMYAQ